MADYKGVLLTQKGRALLAKAQTGAILRFTRAKIGDGVGEALESLNDLVSPKLSLEITHLQAESNGTCHVRTNITNEGLTEGFFVKEFGLFAMDPDLNEEILYAVTTASNPDYIPPDGSATVVNNQVDINILVGNAANVHANINPNGNVNQSDFNDHINKTDDIAHPEVIRTLDSEQVPTGNQGTLTEIINWFANQIKSITGNENWWESPAITLEQLERDYKRIMLQLEMDGRAPGSAGSFLDTLGGNPSRIILDEALADLTVAVAAGTTELHIDMVSGTFTEGTLITIYDDTHRENVLITAVGEDRITIQSLQREYKKGAVVARSSISLDTVKQEMKIGDWGTYSIVVSEVV